MTPDPGTGFAEHAALACPGFRATGSVRRGRKSELLPGELDGAPVIAKRLLRSDVVWDWYFAREIAIYRGFVTAPFRVPRLYAATGDLLVIERFAAPLASVRRPYAELPVATVEALIAIHQGLAAWTFPTEPAPARVHTQLRQRLLEDPIDPAWIRDGIERSHHRHLIDEQTRDAAIGALIDAPLATCHGDLLLRNVLASDGEIVLVDWECAGRYVADWDLALLWTQLGTSGRGVVEAVVTRRRAFLALVVFALCREVVFFEAFRVPVDHRGLARVRRELDEQATALVNDADV